MRLTFASMPDREFRDSLWHFEDQRLGRDFGYDVPEQAWYCWHSIYPEPEMVAACERDNPEVFAMIMRGDKPFLDVRQETVEGDLYAIAILNATGGEPS